MVVCESTADNQNLNTHSYKPSGCHAGPSATGDVSNGTSVTCTEDQQSNTSAPSDPSQITTTAVSGSEYYPVSTPASSVETPVSPLTGSSGYSSGSGNGTAEGTPCDCGAAIIAVTSLPPLAMRPQLLL